jgi:hypothetical protein
MTYGTERNERNLKMLDQKVEGLRIEVVVDDLSVLDDTDLGSLQTKKAVSHNTWLET